MNYEVDENIKLFTHTDLDGVGCVIVSKHYFRHVNYIACDYDNIDQRVLDFIKEENSDSFDKIYITDISIKPDTIKIIKKDSYWKDRFFILDHHQSVIDINDDKNIYVIPEDEETGKLNCGTNLFLEFIQAYYDIEDYISDTLYNFVDLVRDYDTWMWKDNNNQEAFKLNVLFQEIGYTKFIIEMDEKIKENNFFLISKENEEIVNKKINSMKYYYETTNFTKYSDITEIINISSSDYKRKFKNKSLAIAFAESNISYISDRYLDDNSKVDILIIFNFRTGKGSIRTKKEDINVAELAKLVFNGGGHPKASGFTITDRYMYYGYLIGINNETEFYF